jgi:D-alanine-D-alanine ligase
MKVAVLYNRDSQNVINLFGQPNREKMGLKLVKRITDALKEGRHQPAAFESDKDLIDRLEEFMPRVVKGERPGLVLNLSYGIQGQARYTHVPSILEMIGIPYVGSGPVAHSIALDKVVTKVMLVQRGLPTPGFAVLENPEFDAPDLGFPLIVKPKHEAVSFGIRVVNDEGELREAAAKIFDMFGQSVLVERFVEGREVNVGLLGNAPPEPLPPVELSFDGSGPTVYSYEDKMGTSGRTVDLLCPAPIGSALSRKAQNLARRAFEAVGCYDCARVDMRLDAEDHLWILEINSLPSLGPRGSYVRAAAGAGLDFTALVNRLVEVASARYFGTPTPPVTGIPKDPKGEIFSFLTEQRDRIERRLEEWVRRGSRTSDPVGMEAAAKESERVFSELGMRPLPDLTDLRHTQTWETPAGLAGGTLLVAHLDVPLDGAVPPQSFRREPEWLHGEGIGTSRAPLVCLEYALRALRAAKQLRKRRIGVLCYRDEGRDCRYSGDLIRNAMDRARRVLVLRPGGPGGKLYRGRRGQRKYRLQVEGQPARPGKVGKRPEVLVWVASRLEQMAALGSPEERVSASCVDLRTEAFPMLVPHRLNATLLVTYAKAASADRVESEIRSILGKGGPRWELTLVSDRPPMGERTAGKRLLAELSEVAKEWEIPFGSETSVWPSVAGLAPDETAVLCGMGPVARDLYTPQEAVQRISLVQHTLLLAEFLQRTES